MRLQGDRVRRLTVIFAQNLGSEGKAVIRVDGLRAGTDIEAWAKGAQSPRRPGEYSDDFAPLSEHVYKLKLQTSRKASGFRALVHIQSPEAPLPPSRQRGTDGGPSGAVAPGATMPRRWRSEPSRR